MPTTHQEDFRFRPFFSSILFFALAGPPVGSLFLSTFLVLESLITNPSELKAISSYIFLIFFFMLCSYPFALVPALATGIIAGIKPERFKSPAGLLILSVLGGIISATTNTFSLGFLHSTHNIKEIWGFLASFFGLGFLSTPITFLLFNKLLQKFHRTAPQENQSKNP